MLYPVIRIPILDSFNIWYEILKSCFELFPVCNPCSGLQIVLLVVHYERDQSTCYSGADF